MTHICAKISNSLPIQLGNFENLGFQSWKFTEPRGVSLILNTHEIVWIIDNYHKTKRSVI